MNLKTELLVTHNFEHDGSTKILQFPKFRFYKDSKLHFNTEIYILMNKLVMEINVIGFWDERDFLSFQTYYDRDFRFSSKGLSQSTSLKVQGVVISILGRISKCLWLGNKTPTFSRPFFSS